MNKIAQRLAKKFRLLKLALLSDDLKVYPDLKKYFRTKEQADEERYDENGIYHQELDWWYTITNEDIKFFVYKMYGMGISRPLFGYAELFQMTKNTQDEDTICFVSFCSDNGVIENVIGYKIFEGKNAKTVLTDIKDNGVVINNSTFLSGGKIFYIFDDLKEKVKKDLDNRNKNVKSYLHKRETMV